MQAHQIQYTQDIKWRAATVWEQWFKTCSSTKMAIQTSLHKHCTPLKRYTICVSRWCYCVSCSVRGGETQQAWISNPTGGTEENNYSNSWLDQCLWSFMSGALEAEAMQSHSFFHATYLIVILWFVYETKAKCIFMTVKLFVRWNYNMQLTVHWHMITYFSQ